MSQMPVSAVASPSCEPELKPTNQQVTDENGTPAEFRRLLDESGGSRRASAASERRGPADAKPAKGDKTVHAASDPAPEGAEGGNALQEIAATGKRLPPDPPLAAADGPAHGSPKDGQSPAGAADAGLAAGAVVPVPLPVSSDAETAVPADPAAAPTQAVALESGGHPRPARPAVPLPPGAAPAPDPGLATFGAGGPAVGDGAAVPAQHPAHAAAPPTEGVAPTPEHASPPAGLVSGAPAPDIAAANPAAGAAVAGTHAPAHALATGIAVHAPVGSPAWSDDVSGRVVWMAKHDAGIARLDLNPPDLGPINVKVAIQGDQAQITFHAHHPLTRDALDASVDRLRDALLEEGFSQVDVNVGQHGHDRPPPGGGDSDEALVPAALVRGGQEERLAYVSVRGLLDQYA